MVAVLSLSQSALTQVNYVAGIENLPFSSGARPLNIGTLLIGAGTTNAGAGAQFMPTPTQLATYPIINTSAVLMNAVQRVCLPAASQCAGIKVRFVIGAEVLPFALSIGATSTATATVATAVAGQIGGAAIFNAVTLPIGGVVVTFVAAVAVTGDYIEFVSNGLEWSLLAVSSVAGVAFSTGA